ncbi:MAG: hypothetical protein A2464_04355 [Deltaproteobacteria bacterium RIFOXYC2_FULL_48_10]|nr:MAG: hypothetical protein A2464_04355 [Deltaproteobacteria bacterium RIFOXYC2_FULL_48_10]
MFRISSQSEYDPTKKIERWIKKIHITDFFNLQTLISDLSIQKFNDVWNGKTKNQTASARLNFRNLLTSLHFPPLIHFSL